jgi:hypothetical protein
MMASGAVNVPVAWPDETENAEYLPSLPDTPVPYMLTPFGRQPYGTRRLPRTARAVPTILLALGILPQRL